MRKVECSNIGSSNIGIGCETVIPVLQLAHGTPDFTSYSSSSSSSGGSSSSNSSSSSRASNTSPTHMYLIEILVYIICLENIRGPCAMYGGVTHGHSIGAEMNMC